MYILQNTVLYIGLSVFTNKEHYYPTLVQVTLASGVNSFLPNKVPGVSVGVFE